MITQELQLVDLINEFTKFWEIVPNLKADFKDYNYDRLKRLAFDLVIMKLDMRSYDKEQDLYDIDFLTHYFNGNSDDVVAIAEGRL